MNFKTTLFLLVLLAIVGVFFFWDMDHPGEDMDAPTVDQTKQPLLDARKFDKDKIASMTIEKDGKTITIIKNGSEWQQTTPVIFKLNSWSASQPGEKALALTYTEKLAPGKKGAPTLADVNLDKPLATVSLKFSDQTPQQIFKLGRQGIGGRGYLMLNDDASLYVVSDDLHKAILDDDINDWRNKSLKAPAEGQVTQVTKIDSHGTLQMIKADGNWAFGGEHAGRVSRESVSGLLGAINGIYISKFVADKPADLSAYGLDKPTVKLIMQLPPVDSKPATDESKSDDKQEEKAAVKDTTPRYQTFIIGSAVDLKNERYFATFADGQGVGDVVFEISKADYDKFDKNADSLRDAQLTPLVSGDVTKIVVSRGQDVTLQLNKGPEGWGYGDPKPGYGLDQELATQLLATITDAKAQSFVVNPKFSTEPLLKVILGATGRASDDVLAVYDGDEKHVCVVRNNETVGYNVLKDSLSRIINTQVAMLRNRTIKDWKPTDLKVVHITQPDGGSNNELHFVRSDASWKLEGYDKHESFAFGELLDVLAPLKADSWQTSGPVGDKVYAVTCGNDEMTLSMKIDPNTRVASLDEPALSFMVSQEVVDKLKAELRPRTIVDLTRDAITKVQLVTSDQNITIEQKDGKFTAQGVTLDETKVGSLFDTLAGLRVEHYLTPVKISRPISLTIIAGEKTIVIELSDDHTGQIGTTFFKLSDGDFANLTAKMSK